MFLRCIIGLMQIVFGDENMEDKFWRMVAESTVTGPLSEIGCSGDFSTLGEAGLDAPPVVAEEGSSPRIQMKYNQGTVNERAVHDAMAGCPGGVTTEEECTICFSDEVPLALQFVCWSVLELGPMVLFEMAKALFRPFVSAAKQRDDGGEAHVTISVPGGLWVDVVIDLRDETMLEKSFAHLDDMMRTARSYAFAVAQHSNMKVEEVGFRLHPKTYMPEVIAVKTEDGKCYADEPLLLYFPFGSAPDEGQSRKREG